ncbi:MAG: HDOD domain-containing protein [Candidatus Thiodiazotropha sp.]
MTPQQLVQEIEHLVSLPDVCVKVNRLIDAPNYSALTLGDLISQDSDLSARLLRLVNSAFFSLKSPVDTISRAITVVGTGELRNLVMATTAARVFTGIPSDLVDMAEYWRYSITTGVVASVLAKQCHVLHSERLFVMGVLHDIGRLAIYLKLPERARDVLLIAGEDDSLLIQAEQEILGFDHAQVGEALLQHWKLPQSIVDVVAHHHKPSQSKQFPLEAALLHIAASLAEADLRGLEHAQVIEHIDSFAWETTHIDPGQLDQHLETMQDKVFEIMDVVLTPKLRARHNHLE